MFCRSKMSKAWLLVLLSFVVTVIAACGQTASTKQNEPPPAKKSEPTNNAEKQQTANTAGEKKEANGASTELNKLYEAAKKEGKLVIASDPSELYRKVLITTFEKKYPGIKVEYTGMNGRDFRPRLDQERKVGQYLWDIRVSGINPETYDMKDEHVFDPILPLFLPEIADDSKWHGGFKYMFTDKEQSHFPTVIYFAEYRVMVNRDEIPEAQLDTSKDIIDPKFKGKISIQNPKSGGGLAAVTQLYKLYGESFVRDLFTKQEVIITSDKRQQVEWLTRGKYPIALGLEQGFLLDFQKKGIGKNVLPAKQSQDDSLRVLHYLNKAPHPNAAKLYVNWLFSQEGQKEMIQGFEGVSMRKDVEPFDNTIPMDPLAVTHKRMYEENAEVREKAQELVKQLVK